MAVTTRMDPIGQTFQLFLNESLGPAARSMVLAQFAREERDKAIAINRRATEQTPQYETFVDGQSGASEDSVKPDGKIVYEFKAGSDIIPWILGELQKISPRRSGRYANSHQVFADGAQVSGKLPPGAQEYFVMNFQAYARKIEGASALGGAVTRPPQSKSAPEGVYRVVAKMARAKFGKLARIEYNYRSVTGGAAGELRNPAIVVVMR
jgi:hypothetical protein